MPQQAMDDAYQGTLEVKQAWESTSMIDPETVERVSDPFSAVGHLESEPSSQSGAVVADRVGLGVGQAEYEYVILEVPGRCVHAGLRLWVQLW